VEGRVLTRRSLPSTGHEQVDLLLNLCHPLHLDVQLSVDVVEVRHHHVEDVVLVKWSGQTLRAFATRLPDLPATAERTRQTARTCGSLRSSRSHVSSLTLRSARTLPVDATLRHAPYLSGALYKGCSRRLTPRFELIDFGLKLSQPFELQIDITASRGKVVLELLDQRAPPAVRPTLSRKRGSERSDSRGRHGTLE
jgi:hypothetical protein